PSPTQCHCWLGRTLRPRRSPVPVSGSSCVFFFSSRRRHTRFSRDWSSDVCSSDLQAAEALLKQHPQDPLLLLSLGRLCLQAELWGKAREYFEVSLEFSRSPETGAELARLLASQRDIEVSNRQLQEVLALQGQRWAQL